MQMAFAQEKSAAGRKGYAKSNKKVRDTQVLAKYVEG